MSELLESVNLVFKAISDFLWEIPLATAIIGVGLYSVIRTKGIIYREFPYVLSQTFGKIFHNHEAEEGGITAFQAVSTALAATVGTGNIVGVATAITTGGPGAVFWMWFAAVLGMTTKFAEVTLAVAFRQKNSKGEYSGGPMYYIQNGLGKHWVWMAKLFAFFASFAAFGIGAMTQANSIADAVYNQFQVDNQVTGVVITVTSGIILLGGIKRIGQVAEKLVPFMAFIYILGGLAALLLNLDALPSAFSVIISNAFTGTAAAGGFVGVTVMHAIRYGIARGVFTNEAGLGSAPIVHAATTTDHPVRQGIWGAFEVFVDTILVATMTALVIISSGLWQTTELKGSALTAAAFSHFLPSTFGSYIVVFGIVLFAYTTIIGWSYYGEKSIEYLLNSNRAVQPYRLVYIIVVYLGTVSKIDIVWNIADVFNALMALPNIIAVILLMPVVAKLTRQFFEQPEHLFSLEEYQILLEKYQV